MALDGRITNRQYIQLSEAIATTNMDTIAQGYFNLDADVIATIKDTNRGTQATRALIERWAKQPANSGPDQTRVG